MTLARPTRRSAGTRERLLHAALELFAARGYYGTTTALLASHTGLAEGTIYRHFAGKDALYSAVMLGVWERGTALLAAEGARSAPLDRLRESAVRLVAEAGREPAVIQLLLREPVGDALEPGARQQGDRFGAAVVHLVALGKQEGVVRAGTAEVWAALWLAMIGVAADRVAVGAWPADHPNVALTIDAAQTAIARPGAP